MGESIRIQGVILCLCICDNYYCLVPFFAKQMKDKSDWEQSTLVRAPTSLPTCFFTFKYAPATGSLSRFKQFRPISIQRARLGLGPNSLTL